MRPLGVTRSAGLKIEEAVFTNRENGLAKGSRDLSVLHATTLSQLYSIGRNGFNIGPIHFE